MSLPKSLPESDNDKLVNRINSFCELVVSNSGFDDMISVLIVPVHCLKHNFKSNVPPSESVVLLCFEIPCMRQRDIIRSLDFDGYFITSILPV